MEKEAVELFEAAKKAGIAAVNTKSIAEEGRCIDILTQLNNLPVTYQIIPKTQVFIRLEFLTKFLNKKIKDSANDVIRTWKSRIDPNTHPVAVEEIQKTTKPSLPCFVTRWKNLLTACEDEFKNSVREILYDRLYKVVREVGLEEEKKKLRACDPLEAAISMETFLFQQWKSDDNKEIKFRAMLHTISHPKNSDIRKNVLLGQITVADVVNLSPIEIATIGRQKSENLTKIKTNEKNRTKQSTSTNQFKGNG